MNFIGRARLCHFSSQVRQFQVARGIFTCAALARHPTIPSRQHVIDDLLDACNRHEKFPHPQVIHLTGLPDSGRRTSAIGAAEKLSENSDHQVYWCNSRITPEEFQKTLGFSLNHKIKEFYLVGSTLVEFEKSSFYKSNPTVENPLAVPDRNKRHFVFIEANHPGSGQVKGLGPMVCGHLDNRYFDKHVDLTYVWVFSDNACLYSLDDFSYAKGGYNWFCFFVKPFGKDELAEYLRFALPPEVEIPVKKSEALSEAVRKYTWSPHSAWVHIVSNAIQDDELNMEMVHENGRNYLNKIKAVSMRSPDSSRPTLTKSQVAQLRDVVERFDGVVPMGVMWNLESSLNKAWRKFENDHPFLMSDGDVHHVYLSPEHRSVLCDDNYWMA